MKNNIGDWPLIPSNAFLFFPIGIFVVVLGNQIKEGSGEKQWRKIFESGD